MIDHEGGDKLVLWKIMRSLCAETESSCNLLGCDRGNVFGAFVAKPATKNLK